MADQPILSVRGLRTHFELEESTVRAVDGLSYDLYPGKTLAIVGESGSGKSVHALSVLQLLPVPPARIVSGEILFKGRNLLGLPPEEMRKIRGNEIAMVFQEPMTSLNPVHTVGDQIAEAYLTHGKGTPRQARRRAIELLKKVGIPHPEKRIEDYPHQFSGGMRQRAMIAIALACDPDVLIADEPTTALDVTIQAQILELLKDLQKEFGTALVLITHNIGVVAEMADDVVVMYASRVVESAGVERIFKSPYHPYTRGLMGSVPSIFAPKDRLTAIPGLPPDLSKVSKGCPFEPRCSEAKKDCRSKDPMDYWMSKGHRVNCLLYEKDAKEATAR